jgi:hypothetical protein
MFENAAITKVVNANATLPKSEDLKKLKRSSGWNMLRQVDVALWQ